MIRAELITCNWSGERCSNENCKHSTEFHYNIIGNVFNLKKGQTCLILGIEGEEEIYCRDCIDIVYQKLKPVLDSKLWVLK